MILIASYVRKLLWIHINAIHVVNCSVKHVLLIGFQKILYQSAQTDALVI
jgi:hypothetical protein